MYIQLGYFHIKTSPAYNNNNNCNCNEAPLVRDSPLQANKHIAVADLEIFVGGFYKLNPPMSHPLFCY